MRNTRGIFGALITASFVAGCGAGTSSPASLSGPASPIDAVASVSPSPPSSSAPAAAGGSPLLGDAAQARDLVDRYEKALVSGDWQAAWAMLAPAAQAQRGSLADYASERKAYYQSVAGRYEVAAPSNDSTTLADWLSGRTASGLGADLSRAFVVQATYPALAGNNAGFDVFLVAPTLAGTWAIWELR